MKKIPWWVEFAVIMALIFGLQQITKDCRETKLLDTIQEQVEILEEAAPIPGTVTVRLADLDDSENWAYTEWVASESRFEITFSDDMPVDAVILVLSHEWGHILTWDGDEDHSDGWGKASARAYRALIGE